MWWGVAAFMHALRPLSRGLRPSLRELAPLVVWSLKFVFRNSVFRPLLGLSEVLETQTISRTTKCIGANRYFWREGPFQGISRCKTLVTSCQEPGKYSVLLGLVIRFMFMWELWGAESIRWRKFSLREASSGFGPQLHWYISSDLRLHRGKKDNFRGIGTWLNSIVLWKYKRWNYKGRKYDLRVYPAKI